MERRSLDAAAKNREDIAAIKHRYLTGQITREEAQRQAAPVIERINAKMQEIAKKHGKRSYPKMTFIGLFR